MGSVGGLDCNPENGWNDEQKDDLRSIFVRPKYSVDCHQWSPSGPLNSRPNHQRFSTVTVVFFKVGNETYVMNIRLPLVYSLIKKYRFTKNG